MATARNNLEAQLVNDPSHPAVRNFILKTKDIMEAADKQVSVKSDLTALVLIKLALMELEQVLANG